MINDEDGPLEEEILGVAIYLPSAEAYGLRWIVQEVKRRLTFKQSKGKRNW